MRAKSFTILAITAATMLVGGFVLAFDVPGVVNNISADNIDRHAWNDVIGWIDFGPGGGEVEVVDAQLKGYANALQAGPVALDCATSPNGDICASSNFKVSNDGAGTLSGWAWNDNIGWISFNCADQGICGTADYKVTVDGSTGDFGGWAWNDVIGWISFNCANVIGSCSTSDYTVNTSWRTGPNPPFSGGGPTGIGPSGGGGSEFDVDTYLVSKIFDTRVQGGAALNTIMWLGDQPAGTEVGIQVASSNSASGPWSYVGPDSKSSSAYQANQGVQFRLNPKDHNNKRYFRYKVFLYWVSGKTPEVQDVVVSYSP